MVDGRRPEPAKEFGRNMELAIPVFKGSHRSFEIARIRQTIRTDRPQFRQAERQSVVFADIPTGLLLGQHNAEFDAARNDTNLARCYLENSELRMKSEYTHLRNNQHLSIR